MLSNERTRKTSRIAAIALAVVMTVGIIPADVSAAKTGTEQTETKTVETTYTAPESSRSTSMYARSVKQATANSTVTNELVSKLKKHQTTIVLTKGSIKYTATSNSEIAKQVGKYVGNVLNDHPELFYVSASGIKIYPNRSNKTVVKLVPKYTMSASSAAKATAKMKSQARSIEKQVKRTWSTKNKAKKVNDLLKAKVTYKKGTTNCQNAYGALVEHKGVCQAYTMAYEYIMRDLGVRTSFRLNNSGSHIWNRVLYRGKWYTIDVTWNDTTRSNKYFWKTSHAM